MEYVGVLALLGPPRGKLRGARQALVGLAEVASAPHVVGQLGQGTGLLERRTLDPAALDGVADHRDRLELVVGEVASAGAALEQRCAFGERQVGGVAEGARALGRGLADAPARAACSAAVGAYRSTASRSAASSA